MSEEKVEFIESYIKIKGGDYEWNDNHGELIRCRDCVQYVDDWPDGKYCKRFGGHYGKTKQDDFCSYGERR